MRRLKKWTDEEMEFFFGENWREIKPNRNKEEEKPAPVKEKTPFAKLLEEKAKQRYKA